VRGGEKYVFVSDCEGPISKNDNAFELASHLIPEGDYFFTLLSRYDDVLAYLIRRPRYCAGYTLKLIAPFLKAYGATNENMKEFSRKTLVLIREASETLQFVQSLLPSYIVSTSYEQYISAVCEATGFPFENARCTSLDLDRYHLSEGDHRRLEQFREEIVSLPMIEAPKEGASMQALSERDQETVRVLDKIFWEELPRMSAGKIMFDTEPLGGLGKAEAVQRIVKDLRAELSNVIYVGDSITDAAAMEMVKRAGGFTVSFNGNEYAVRQADVAVMSDNTLVTSILVEVLVNLGREKLMELVSNWSLSELKRLVADDALIERFEERYKEGLPRVEAVTLSNVDRLSHESGEFRKTVRGEMAGRLG